MSNALTTDRTVVADDDLLASDYNNARADLHSVAEGFYDAGTPDLPLAMQVAGVHWSDPTSKAFRFFRQTATGADAREKSSPLRPVWHYNDQTGDPADDARVAEGDLLVYDDGTNPRFLKACNNVSGVRSFYGLGVRADNRTTATVGSPRQSSDVVKLRAQLYTGGAAKFRDAWWQVIPDIEDSTEYSKIHLWWRREEDGSNLDILTIFQNRSWGTGKRDSSTLELRDTEVASGPAITDSFACAYRSQPGFAAGVSVTRHNYFDAMNLVLGSGATVTDAAFIRFNAAAGTHKALDAATGGAHAWLKHNENGTIRYEPWFDAKQLESRWSTAATGGGTLQNSGDFRWRGSYWNGAAATDFYAYSRLVMDETTPNAHLRFGFSAGSATLDFYNTGALWVRGDADQNVWLTAHTDADSGDKDRDSLAMILRATSWDGAAAQDRGVAQLVTVTSPADASDTWNLLWSDIDSGSSLMILNSLGNLGVGGAPATRFHSTETTTITGAVTDGYSASVTLSPTYTAATAQTVTRHNYFDIKNVTLAGAGPAALTDACVMRFDAAAGTHKAVDSSSTKTTPGGVDAWIKVNINGTIHFVPAFVSKTA